MTLAISTGMAVLAWIGLGAGALVLLLVLALFWRVLRPALEVERYARDILAAGLGIAENVDGVDELARTRELVGAVPQLVEGYAQRLGGRA
jgi:hypothetical protein